MAADLGSVGVEQRRGGADRRGRPTPRMCIVGQAPIGGAVAAWRAKHPSATVEEGLGKMIVWGGNDVKGLGR